MDIQTLQSENEKLNARLRKAIQVFNQQKADIERLESEKEVLTKRVDELEVQVSANAENDTKFFEQLQEIDNLNSLLEDANNAITAHTENYDKLAKETSETISTLEGKVEDLTSKNKSLNGKLLSANNEIKKQEDYIKEVSKNTNAFVDKMKIFISSIGQQANALSEEVNNTKLL